MQNSYIMSFDLLFYLHTFSHPFPKKDITKKFNFARSNKMLSTIISALILFQMFLELFRTTGPTKYSYLQKETRILIIAVPLKSRILGFGCISSGHSYYNSDVNSSLVHKFCTVILRIHNIHKIRKTKIIKTGSRMLVFG